MLERFSIRPRVLAFTVYLSVVVGILGLILVQVMTATGERRGLLLDVAQLERENAEQVAEHRHANQADHDQQNACLVALSILLADPKRDRNQSIVPPKNCLRPPASTPLPTEVQGSP